MAQPQSPAPRDVAKGPYSVVERGAHHKVWERIEVELAPDGTQVEKRKSYQELATGMHFKNERGEWEESKEEIEILPNDAGAIAAKGPRKVIFPVEIKAGIIEMQTPDGKWLRSRVWGLAYFDASSGESVLLAEVKESDGQLVGDNVVVYPDAFTDFRADVRYTYTRAGFEQDVVLRENPPAPQDFGLNPATTRLQVLTEFVEAATPQKITSQAGGLSDQTLGFGTMNIGMGKAFSVDAKGVSGEDIPVLKQWNILNERSFLIEEVLYENVDEQLRKLLAGQRTVLTNTAGDYRHFTYDNAGQLKTALGYEADTTPRFNEQLGYRYDPAGNLNFRTNHAFVQTFNVDNRNQLTTLNRSGTLTVSGNTTAPATNVTVNGLTADRYADLTYARTNFPLVDAMTNFTAIAASSTGLWDTNTVMVDLRATNVFVYDLNGNLRTNGVQILEYDDENRLATLFVAGAWKSEFVYDGANRCRIQRDYKWDAGTSGWSKTNEVRLFYDGVTVIQERDGNNTPVVSYTRTGSAPLARTDHGSSSHAYYHTDGNLNVTVLVNGSQLVVAKYAYDPFGNTLAVSGPLAEANAYRFASQRHHGNSGLVLYLRRAYSPSLQRFVNRDPIAEAGGMNLYGFVGNNPISFYDPLGLAWYDDLAAWAQGEHQQFSQAMLQTSGDGNHWLMAGALNTVSELAAGFLSYPQALSQLGTGSGTFSAEPSLANAAGLASDVSLTAGVLAGGLAPLPSANVPMFRPKPCPPPTTQPAVTPVNIEPPPQSLLPVKYNKDFAELQQKGQLLPSITPEGRILTDHAINRMLNGEKGRPPMSVADVDKVLNEGNVIRKYSADNPKGATIAVQNTLMPNKPVVVVDAATGRRIVTVISKVK